MAIKPQLVRKFLCPLCGGICNTVDVTYHQCPVCGWTNDPKLLGIDEDNNK